MPRASWFDDSEQPALEQHLRRLDHFAKSMEDGVIDEDELAQQQENLMLAMKEVEPLLDDDLHEKVTHLLVETIAYGVMKTLHDMVSAMAQSE